MARDTHYEARDFLQPTSAAPPTQSSSTARMIIGSS